MGQDKGGSTHESGEVIASGIRTEVAHNIPRHRIAIKETREDS